MKNSVRLHQFPHSHYCIRIRWVLGLKGIPYEVVNYTWDTVERVKAVSPGWERVPVLEWNREVITDSARIAAFIDAKVPEPKLFPNETSRSLTAILLAWIDGAVMRNAARYMLGDYLAYVGPEYQPIYEKFFFQPTFGINVDEALERRAEWEGLLREDWRKLELALAERPFISGPSISYADFGIASRLKLMEMIGKYTLPAEFPRVAEWFTQVKQAGREP